MTSIFIVNLQKDVEKRDHICKLCLKYDLHCNFVEAVNGLDLHQGEIDEIYLEDKAINVIGRPMSKGEIGCFLSHRKIYKQIIDENIEYTLILEDDVNFDNKLIDILRIIKTYRKYWDIILLGHHSGESRNKPTRFNFWHREPLNRKFVLRIPSEKSYGTYGYLLSLNGARRLYQQTEKCFMPIDHYTGDVNLFKLFIVEDPIIYLHKEFTKMSNLENDRINIVEKKENQMYKNIFIYSFIVRIMKNIDQLKNKIWVIANRFRPLRKYNEQG